MYLISDHVAEDVESLVRLSVEMPLVCFTQARTCDSSALRLRMRANAKSCGFLYSVDVRPPRLRTVREEHRAYHAKMSTDNRLTNSAVPNERGNLVGGASSSAGRSGIGKISKFCNFFSNFWRACSRLYQNEILQENMRFN